MTIARVTQDQSSGVLGPRDALPLVKTNEIIDQVNANTDKLDTITSPFLLKGEINLPADFPIPALVQNGWLYEVKTAVTDNDPTRTNTGQTFEAQDEVAWDGAAWIVMGHANPPPTKIAYIDNSRVDAYVADGSIERPFKTIQAAIAAIAAAAPDYYVTVDIAAGVYRENIVLENAGLKYLKLQGHGYVSINPAAGNALQSTANNANLYALHLSDLIFAKPVVLTGGAGDTSFSDTLWTNVRFTAGSSLTASCINNITMVNVYSEVPFAYTNVSWSYLESGQLQGTFSFVMDSTQPVPAGGKDGTILANGIFQSGTVSYTVGGTASYTVAVNGCRWGSGAVAVPAGLSIIAYNSALRGTITNNGAVTLRGATMQGYVAGIGSLTLSQPASQVGNDSAVPGTSAKDALDLLQGILSVKKRMVCVDGNRADIYVADGSESRPYKTIAAAIAVAVNTDLIKIAAMPGGYTEDIVLPSGVSIEGYGSNNTIIKGDVTTGAAPISLRGLQFNGIAKTLNLNGPASISDCFSYNQVIVGNATIQAWNFHITTTGVTALVLNHANARYQSVLSTISATGDVPTILGTNGAAILDLCKILGSRAADPVVNSAAGYLQLLNTMVVNAGGGAAMSADNGAGAGAPNMMHGVFTVGVTAFGTAVTIIDNITGGAVTGAAIVYNPGTFVAAGAVGAVWAVSKPATRTDAIDRLAAALSTHLGVPI